MSEIENQILLYLKPFCPEKIGIFGSYARKENTTKSDIDILIKFQYPVSLFQLIKIENELSEKIGIHVDLVTEDSINNIRIKQSIKQDLHIIYNA